MDVDSITLRDSSQHDTSIPFITDSDTIGSMKTLGQKIRAAREEKGFSQAHLADLCGWDSQGRVGNYEKDAREPKFDDLRKMARILKKPMSYFIEDAEPSNVTEGPQIQPRPPVIEDDFWRGLSPRTRALVEEIVQKAGDGRLPDEEIKFIQEVIDKVTKK